MIKSGSKQLPQDDKKELPEKSKSTTRSTRHVPNAKGKKLSEGRQDFKLPHIPAKFQTQIDHSPRLPSSMVPQCPPL